MEQKKTRRCRGQTCCCRGVGAGMDWVTDVEDRPVIALVLGKAWTRSLGLADANYHIEWINSQVLLYSLYAEINHNGEDYKKECIYLHSWIMLLCSRN